jgi:hypothetical protein
MKKHIAEDLPARSHPQAQMSSQNKKPQSNNFQKKDDDRGGEKTPEQKVRQAVYDIRYRARRENIPLRTAYSQYMQNSSLSEQEKTQVRDKLFGKSGSGDSSGGSSGGGGGMQAEDFALEIKESASDSMAKALYKVFVEKPQNYYDIDELKYSLGEESNSKGSGKKYKVRVTDRDSGVTYVRYATREKINQLRARGLNVEMTEYGDPYEGEKKNDGKNNPNDKNLANNYPPYDKVTRGDVITGRLGKDQMGGKNMKESFLDEVSSLSNSTLASSQVANPDTSKPVDFATKPNKVTVNPQDSSNVKLMAHRQLEGDVILETGYSKFLGILNEKKMTKSEKRREQKLKSKYDKSGMKASMKQQYGSKEGENVYFATIRKQAMKEDSCGGDPDKDSRGMDTTKSLIRTKLQSMGIKNPMIIPVSKTT